MLITSIHQPSFFPWLGLLDKIAKTNQFVLLDHVKLVKGTNQYRNQFYCQGEFKYLTLPVSINSASTFVNANLKHSNWINEHLKKISNYYRKSPFFDLIYGELEPLYRSFQNDSFLQVLFKSMEYLFEKYDIKAAFINSSSLDCSTKNGDLVFEICQKTNTNVYLSGRGALNYLTNDHFEQFKNASVELVWHSFKHPIYVQDPKFNFVEGLSSLDLLFFKGPMEAKNIFWENVNKNLLPSRLS